MHRGLFLVVITTALAATLNAPLTFAQAIPDAAQISRDTRVRKQPADIISGEQASIPSKKGTQGQIKLPLKSVVFSGNTVYNDLQLTALLQLKTSEDGVLFDDLVGAVDRISLFYRAQGYPLARAFLPEQTSADGVIKVMVLEGYYAKYTVNNNSDLTQTRIDAMLQAALCGNKRPDCIGSVVTEKGNERAVSIVNDIPGIRAKVALEPGRDLGTTSFVMDVKPSNLPRSTVGVDNYGGKSTGVYRISASTDWLNMRGEGDVLSLSGSASDKRIWSGNASYSVLVGYTGMRVGLSAGHGQYLLGDAFASLNAHGDSNTLGGFVSYPLVRHRARNLTLRAAMDYKVQKDSIEATGMHFDKRNNTYLLGGYGDGVDGSGYSTYSLTWSGGNLRMLDTNSIANDASAMTAGGYGKMTYAFARQQALYGAWTMYGAVNGMTGNKNLDGSEKMGLGGSSGVRGYPAGEAAGDKGAIGNLELRYTQLVQQNQTTLTYVAYVDRGWVQTSITPWTTAAPTKSLTGYGIGLLLNKAYDFSMRAMYATHSANAPSTVDPTSKYQFWLQASKNF
jgi:hemolysin activation/secretion protein